MMAATLWGTPAAALAQSATAQISSQINEPASIGVIQNLAFSISPQALNTGLVITAGAAGGLNANILVDSGANTAVSLSVPASISVVRDGGVETITVRTVGTFANTAGGAPVTVAGIASGGMLTSPIRVVGAFSGGVFSFSVGGVITVASTLVPGEYHGVLTVIAEYN